MFQFGRRAKLVLGVAIGGPLLYGVTGVGVVKGYYSIAPETREKVPSSLDSVVKFYESNYRILRFTSSMAAVTGAYTIAQFKRKRLAKRLGEEYIEDENYFHETHENCASIVLNTLEDLGGIFIKFGQGMSMMKGVIPEEYVNVMAKLQDKVSLIC